MLKRQKQQNQNEDEAHYEENPDFRMPIDFSSYFKNIGRITFKTKNGDIVYGTAFLIHKNILVTCAHNIVHNGTPMNSQRIRFILAQNGKEKQQDIFLVISIRIHPLYLKNYKNKNERSKYDYALLQVYNEKIETLHNWSYMTLLSVSDLEQNKMKNQQYLIEVFGYPYKQQDQVNRIFKMYGSSTKEIFFQKQQNGLAIRFLNYKLNTRTGHSGSPIVNYWKDGVFGVFGIHISGKSSYKNCNRGILFTEQILKQISIWAREITGQEKNFKMENYLMKNKNQQKQSIGLISNDLSDTQSDFQTIGKEQGIIHKKENNFEKLIEPNADQIQLKDQKQSKKDVKSHEEKLNPKQKVSIENKSSYHINLISQNKISNLSTVYHDKFYSNFKQQAIQEESRILNEIKKFSLELKSQEKANDFKQNFNKQRQIQNKEIIKEQNPQINKKVLERIYRKQDLDEFIKPNTYENLDKLIIKNICFNYKLLQHFHNLKYVILQKTQCSEIHSIPPFYQDNLIFFASNWNSVTKIQNIFHLKNVFVLSLQHNLISVIPPEIEKLKRLKEINFSYNVIQVIPKEVYKLHYLQEIDLNENLIEEISPFLVEAKHLTVFNIEDNKIKDINLNIEDCGPLSDLNLRMKGNKEIRQKEKSDKSFFDFLRALKGILKEFQY